MAKESQGVICYWATASITASAASNVVGEVVGWSGPSMSAAVIDVTNLVSTAKEKLVGVYDGGQVTLNVNWAVTNDGQRIMRESLAARTLGNLAIQLSTTTTAQFIRAKGYVTGMNLTGSVDNKQAGDFTVAITAGVTFSTG